VTVINAEKVAAIIWAADHEADAAVYRASVFGQALLAGIVAELRAAGVQRIGIIATAPVKAELSGRIDAKVTWLPDEQSLDFGQAIIQTEDWLKGFEGDILLVDGTSPFVDRWLFLRLWEGLKGEAMVGCLPVAKLRGEGQYDRIIRNSEGQIVSVLPAKEVPQHISGNEITGLPYCFEWDCLQRALYQVETPDGRRPLQAVVEKVTDNGFRVNSLPLKNFLPLVKARSEQELQNIRAKLKEMIDD